MCSRRPAGALNSITQGEPVPALFAPLFSAGWRIKFAHQTFAWTLEAPGAAAVHCVIIGLDKHPRRAAVLYEYDDARGAPKRVPVADRINAYLADGVSVFVEQRRSALNDALPKAVFGNMARDDGNLIVEREQYVDVSNDPVAAKYLRPFVGARELIHHERRWCLWLVDLDPSDVQRSSVLRSRLEDVRAFRADSRAASTRQMAETPHLFGQRAPLDVPHLVIPRHMGEHRRFFLAERFGADIIVGDANFMAEDPDGFAFGVVSSSAFIA